jgi:hypothetical protein
MVHQVWHRPGSTPPNAIHVVREPRVCLWLLLFSLALAALAPVLLVTMVVSALHMPDGIALFMLDGIVLFMLAGILAYCMYLIYQANNAGVVVDLTGDSVEFWGLYFSANRISDLFSPDFLWMKLFGRATIRLSEISQIATHQRTFRPQSKKDRPAITYFLILNGAFGAAKIRFFDIEKRDELLAVLRQANRMGFPVTSP